MKIGIIGLPQTGKKSLFKLLTGVELNGLPQTAKATPGIAAVRDRRFNDLVAMYRPKKEVQAKIDVVLLPKLEKAAIAKGDIFQEIADVNAICHVVRAFKDDSVYHVDGSVNSGRDIVSVNTELILHDQIFVEKRIERISETLKKNKNKDQEQELELFQRLQPHLEQELPLRVLELSFEERKKLQNYPLITQKEMIVVLNVADEDAANPELREAQKDDLAGWKIEIMQVAAKMEAEINELETQEEKDAFLRDFGIPEPAIDTLTRLCMKSLGLNSFFTVGADEVRQWTVRKGALAPEAAGEIHSDLEKGFIRAEVMKYNELMAAGSEDALKKSGKHYLKGKDYEVCDGDILSIRFNV